MDILEEKGKSEYDTKLKDVINIFKFKNFPIELKGSAGLKSQKYFSDYDLLSKINESVFPKEVYEFLINMFKKVELNENLYFVEMKIQNKLGDKFKYFPNDDLSFKKFNEQFKNNKFIKVDFILYNKNRFIEISIIYLFDSDNYTTEDFIKDMERDIKEYYDEGNYFKVLKRQFKIEQAKNNREKAVKLTKILNSELGRLYQHKSNLEAILRVLESYPNDDFIKKKSLVNLQELKIEPNLNLVKKLITELNTKINNEVKKKINFNTL